jgi:hypothetical protein
MDNKILQNNLENAKSLDDCKVFIEKALQGYYNIKKDSYSKKGCVDCFITVFNANIRNKWKKSLIHALQTFRRIDLNDSFIKEYILFNPHHNLVYDKQID